MIFIDVNGDILKSLVYYIYFGKVDLSSEKREVFETLVTDLQIKEFTVETESIKQHKIDLSVKDEDTDIAINSGQNSALPEVSKHDFFQSSFSVHP